MKNIYVVFDCERDGKRYAIAETIRTGENLKNFIDRYSADICHLCESRAEAEKIALEWNNQHTNEKKILYVWQKHHRQIRGLQNKMFVRTSARKEKQFYKSQFNIILNNL